MPTVKWAEIAAVPQALKTLRDNPERPGDVFAAVFDSARHSVGSRIDRAIREQQRTLAPKPREAVSAGDKTADRRTDEQKRLLGGGRTERSPETSRPEPHEQGCTKSKATNDDADWPASSEKRDRSTDGSAAGDEHEQLTAQDADRQSSGSGAGEATGSETSDPPQTDRDENDTPVDSDSDSESSEPKASAEAMSLLVGDPANLISAALLQPTDAASAGEATAESDLPTPLDLAPATLETAGTTREDQLSAAIRQIPSLPLNVWNAFRQFFQGGETGPGTRLITLQQYLAGSVSASAAAAGQQVTGGVGDARPAGDPIALALLAAGAESEKPVSKQPDGQSNDTRHDGGAASQQSSGDTARSSDATQVTGASDEFRSLLDAAGRVRDRVMLPATQAPGLLGRDLNGKGVNLSDARAVTELADVVRANIGGRHSSMVLRLDPPELGQLRIDVRMHGQELSIRLQADTLAGHDALQSKLNDLRSSLEQHGFKLNQVQVELRVPQSASPDSHQERLPQQQGDWNGHASHEPAWQGSAGDGGDSSPDPGASSGEPAFSRENASPGDESDWAQRLAETGVDLVV